MATGVTVVSQNHLTEIQNRFDLKVRSIYLLNEKPSVFVEILLYTHQNVATCDPFMDDIVNLSFKIADSTSMLYQREVFFTIKISNLLNPSSW